MLGFKMLPQSYFLLEDRVAITTMMYDFFVSTLYMKSLILLGSITFSHDSQGYLIFLWIALICFCKLDFTVNVDAQISQLKAIIDNTGYVVV